MFIRLTTLLCASLYGGMLFLGTQPTGPGSVEASVPSIQPDTTQSAFSPSTEVVAINASFSAGNLDQPVTENAVPPSEEPTFDDGLIRISSFDAPARVLQAKGIDVVEVTGTLVNLRAGPTTTDDVVGRLRLGTRAELIAEAGGGWMQIRDLDTGTEGFMSGDFLSPITPG